MPAEYGVDAAVKVVPYMYGIDIPSPGSRRRERSSLRLFLRLDRPRGELTRRMRAKDPDGD